MRRELANETKGAQRKGVEKDTIQKEGKNKKKVQKNTKSVKTSKNGKPTYLDDDDS